MFLCCKMNEQILNIKFVEEVEKYPVLYNYTLPGYSRKDVTEQAWSKVGKTVNLSGSDCREKWKNLRAVFVRSMKPTPSGPGAKKRKPYYLTEAMQFATPFIRALNPEAPGNSAPPNRQDVLDQEEENEDADVKPLNSSPLSSSLTPLQFVQTSEEPNDIGPHLPLPPKDYRKKELPKHSLNDGVDKRCADYFEAKKAKLASDNAEATKMFLLSVLPELEEMTNQQLKIFKRKVLQTIDEIMNDSCKSSHQNSPASMDVHPSR